MSPPLFGEDALASTHRLDAATTISRLSQILARHTGDWASDDTALLALRVPAAPLNQQAAPTARD